jgi:poly-gamma-glutamate capsule biosynthesis protein CapA/YwtB (metallophosphatase superfamily)
MNELGRRNAHQCLQLLRIALLVSTAIICRSTFAVDTSTEVDSKSKSTAEPTVQAIFAGDIMLDELPGEAIHNGVDPFDSFAKVLHDADLVVGNLECVVATTGEKIPKPYNFRARPEVIQTLTKHLTAVTVANNHSGDYGKGALAEEFDLLEKAPLLYFGGGRNFDDAHKPLIYEHNGIKIALLGYDEFKPRSFEAGLDTPGIAWSDDRWVIADFKAAREKYHADLVIPFMHWGWEYEEVSDRQRALAHIMIAAGADAVIGAHPHVRQAIEYIDGKPVFYSLGNFVFNGFDDEETLTGWAVQISLDKQGMRNWNTLVAKIDERGIPHLDGTAESPHGKRGTDVIEDYNPPYPKTLRTPK